MANHAQDQSALDGMTDRFIKWCARDTDAARLQRTVAQGVIGVGVGAITNIAGAPEWVTMIVIPGVMAVLAPVQAAIGNSGKVNGDGQG